MTSFQSKIIPKPGDPPNVKRDALRVFEILNGGGIAICPTEVGYGLLASSSGAIAKAFSAKKRRLGHPQGVVGCYALHRDLHILPDERFEMTRVLTDDLDMSMGIVAPYRANHPIWDQVTGDTRRNVTKDGRLAMHVGGGSFLNELTRLNYEAGQLMIGSSANLTGSGQKFRVEDIEDEIKNVASIIVDYGLQRYHIYGRPSINMDFENMQILRMGSCYELFRERMMKFWGIALPEDLEDPKAKFPVFQTDGKVKLSSDES